MNKAKSYKIRIFACIGFLVCTKRTYDEETNTEYGEQYMDIRCLNTPKYIQKGKFSAVKKLLLSRHIKDAMSQKDKKTSQMTDNTQYTFATHLPRQTQVVFFAGPTDNVESKPRNTSLNSYPQDSLEITQTNQKIAESPQSKTLKITLRKTRMSKIFEENSNLFEKCNAQEISISGMTYFKQLFEEAEHEARMYTKESFELSSRRRIDFEKKRRYAMAIYNNKPPAFLEHKKFKAWNRGSCINLIAYNFLMASQLNASSRDKLMNAYSAISFQCIDYNRSSITKYLSSNMNSAYRQTYKAVNCYDHLSLYEQYQLSLTLDGTMDAMDRNASAAKIKSKDFSSYIHDYIRFLRCIIYGKEFERQGNFNPAIKLLLSSMIEFVFWIEERIRLLSMQKIFVENDIKHITDEYDLLKVVIYNYRILCGREIIQIQSKECRAKLAEEEWSCAVEIYTNENNRFASYNTKKLSRALKNLKQAIQTLRTHIQDSIKDQASNQYILYDEAMRICYHPKNAHDVTDMCAFIYFILAFTQKCDVCIANYRINTEMKKSNSFIQTLVRSSVEMSENAVLTLFLVCEYLSNGKCDRNDIALIYPDGMRAYKYSIDPANSERVKTEEIINIFSYFYEKIRTIISCN